MKQVLIIEEAPLLREYLNFKLAENDIEVNLAKNGLEGSSRMRIGAPDLVILDYSIGGSEYRDVLKQKKMNPNTVNIPVILLARRIDQKKIFELLPFDVKKVYTKPLNPDPFFSTIAEILHVPFKNMDTSPGVVEVHVNEDIIFVEISKGLNRDKLDLLHFKIREMVELYEIRVPKVIVMISNTKLTFSDTPNLQKLLETIIQSCKSRARYIRILTRDPFVRQFVEKQNDYGNIHVVSSLLETVKDLLQGVDEDDEFRVAEILGDRVLSANETGGEESLQMRFSAEVQTRKPGGIEGLRESLKGRKITIVDDDSAVQGLVKNTFEKFGLPVREFSNGSDFLAAMEKESCDLLFLDLLMPKVDGFDVLKALNTRKDSPPVIVISTITQRDTVVRAFQLGVKSYLTKPIKPQEIFKKAIEILEPNF
ncbi:MAG: response regulator [Treponema sp.]|jgi:DNA-binding response OmpR family regulator|nr:response regulator [Treponema sp.]